jgi:hypothetical protein
MVQFIKERYGINKDMEKENTSKIKQNNIGFMKETFKMIKKMAKE